MGEADRKSIGIVRCRRLHQEAERIHIGVSHEALRAIGLLQRAQPCGRDQARAERSKPGAILDVAAPALLEIDRSLATGDRLAVRHGFF